MPSRRSNPIVIPRGQLDIDWASLLATEFDVLGGGFFQQIPDVERSFAPLGGAVAFLSVRSGLEGLLAVKDWPAGSEVLMSAVNIPAMSEIFREHGVVPIPLDVSPTTLTIDVQQVIDRITPRTRAILIAHLFGCRLNLGELQPIAQRNQIELWEDLAQGFHGVESTPPCISDVCFFSFGLIKARTAVGGAVLVFRDHAVAQRCREQQSRWPVQSPRQFRQRVHRALLFRLLSHRACFSLVSALVSKCGGDMDELLSRHLRGFRAGPLPPQLRRRPCPALLRLLQRRQKQSSEKDAAWKANLVAEYRRRLPLPTQVGLDADFPSHWVFPILSERPAALRLALWRQGYDATVRGSQLQVLPAAPSQPSWEAPQARTWVPQLLYLPLHPAMTRKHIQQIAHIVSRENQMA